jgi:tetratricopeptide (TPR) repeat protein
MARRKLGALVVVMTLMALSTIEARADSRAELEKARASFLARNWTEAEDRLRTLLDPNSKNGLKERPLISQARMYLGATMLVQGRKDEAKEAFEKLVLDDPTFEPDPLSFPGEAINTFIDVRGSLLEQIKAATQNAARLAAEKKAKEEAEREAQRVWLEKVKAQAGEEKITVRHSRIVASLPFGVGQFQNGQQIAGFFFLSTEVLSLAGTVVTYAMFRYARDREAEELSGFNQLSAQWHQRAEDLRLVNLGFAGGFLLLTAAGILQANLAYVPEAAETKKRDLPPLGGGARSAKAFRVMPMAAPLPGGGGFVGVQGFAF